MLCGGPRLGHRSWASVRARVGNRGRGAFGMSAAISVHLLGAAAEHSHVGNAGIIEINREQKGTDDELASESVHVLPNVLDEKYDGAPDKKATPMEVSEHIKIINSDEDWRHSVYGKYRISRFMSHKG
ncbi:hypothetical protein NDU88_004288 [Pleurodeles waltl]|uniref:Uncharacterized protein n=1 Tax=Pleurodeles waltl TaxID=8319 RepID=A0AAV7NKN4_PLEWA|nr:hypothetical protein NDU88_004288 [Pleurodeles waltl]